MIVRNIPRHFVAPLYSVTYSLQTQGRALGHSVSYVPKGVAGVYLSHGQSRRAAGRLGLLKFDAVLTFRDIAGQGRRSFAVASLFLRSTFARKAEKRRSIGGTSMWLERSLLDASMENGHSACFETLDFNIWF